MKGLKETQRMPRENAGKQHPLSTHVRTCVTQAALHQAGPPGTAVGQVVLLLGALPSSREIRQSKHPHVAQEPPSGAIIGAAGRAIVPTED